EVWCEEVDVQGLARERVPLQALDDGAGGLPTADRDLDDARPSGIAEQGVQRLGIQLDGDRAGSLAEQHAWHDAGRAQAAGVLAGDGPRVDVYLQVGHGSVGVL